MNEDGEPIIEITEHIPDDSSATRSSPSSAKSSVAPVSNSNEPSSLNTTHRDVSSAPNELTEDQLARRRRIRNALLDQLEAEEAEEERRQQRVKMQTNSSRSLRTGASAISAASSSAIRPSVAPPKLALAIPLPKGTSSSLVPDIIGRPPSMHAAIKEPPPSSGDPEPKILPPLKPRTSKSVTFASDVKPASSAGPLLPPPDASKKTQGDVILGKLRDAKHESLRALQMDVVERPPPRLSTLTEGSDSLNQPKKLSFKARRVQLRQVEVDSDDEDEEDGDTGANISGFENGEFGHDSQDSDDSVPEDAEEEEDDENDWDEAMLQRELALAYYEQQGMMRDLRHSAIPPSAPNISADLGSWEQEVCVLTPLLLISPNLLVYASSACSVGCIPCLDKTPLIRISLQSRTYGTVPCLKSSACGSIPCSCDPTWESC